MLYFKIKKVLTFIHFPLGVYDQLCLNLPVFIFGDPQLFTHLAHSVLREPRTGLLSPDNFWDFFSLTPESLNSVTLMFTEPVVMPDGFRRMSAFPINAFQLTNQEGEHFYVKFSWFPDQGERSLNVTEAARIASK